MHHPFSLAAPVGSIHANLRRVGAALKAARQDRGDSIARQAKRAGLSPLTVERIERGACSVSFGEVLALAMSLRVRVDLHLPNEPQETWSVGAPTSERGSRVPPATARPPALPAVTATR